MKKQKRRIALALALVMLLVPALALALDVELNLNGGAITVEGTGTGAKYSQGAINDAPIAVGDTVTIFYTPLDDEVSTLHNVNLNNTGSTAITIKGNIAYKGTGDFLTLQGTVGNLTLKSGAEIVVMKDGGAAIRVKNGADATLSMDGTEITSLSSGSPAIKVGDGGEGAATLLINVNSTSNEVDTSHGDGPYHEALKIEDGSKVTVSGGELTFVSKSTNGTITGSGTLAVSGVVVAQNYAVDATNEPVAEDITVIGTKTTDDENSCTTITPLVIGGATPTTNITLSSNPDDIAAYIPLGNTDGDNMTVNGIHINPDRDWKTNTAKITGADLLVAGLLSQDPSLYKEISPTASKNNVTIRQGAAYESLNPLPGAKGITWYGLFQKTKLSGSLDPNMQAMNLLQGQTYSLNMGDQNLINLGIGNIWQAPIPDENYDSFSQYVPPAPLTSDMEEDAPEPED